MQGSHRWTEDAAELRLEVQASSEQAVFAEAFHALRELFAVQETGGEPVQRQVEAEADDHRTLLAEWLAELVFLVEKERLVLDDVSGVRVLDGQLEATVRAHRGDPPHRVKGVAYHDLDLHRDRDGWRGTVVLDV
ncbi:MAG TPA: archease [Solirubrobacteraceae bacterium]|nr:archease [Solirubrobacteraceae bacterium]